jgi:hypothetical protein
MRRHPLILARLEQAVLGGDRETTRTILEQLDLMSANECLRQLGEEWRFPTIEVDGQQVMLMQHLGQLVYGYAAGTVSNLTKILSRFGRKPLYLQRYSRKYQEAIRRTFALEQTVMSVAFAT